MRYELANLACLAALVAGGAVGALLAGWPWWAVLLASLASFFMGGFVVERLAPGTRFLDRWDRRSGGAGPQE